MKVGINLLSKFLGALLQVEKKPKIIICVNNAVKMTTNRSHPSFKPLKDLEAAGVQILSCGSCLEAYKLVSDLTVGEISNAYEIIDILSTHEQNQTMIYHDKKLTQFVKSRWLSC